MTDDAAFLAAICARPDDDLPRLVYADWLDEHGRGERGEFIRVQCAIATHDHRSCNQGICRQAGHGPCRACRGLEDLRRRERELLAAHGDEWFVEDVARPAGLYVEPPAG